MGITRCGRHKRKATGGARNQMQKKRKNMMGRQPANTKIGGERVKDVRVRGGNFKQRALRLNMGDFKYFDGSSFTNSVSTIQEVVYHPSSNELMRTNTLTKSAVVKINCSNFDLSNCYEQDKVLKIMMERGYLLAIIESRPGQEGNANGRVLQGAELEFYQNKLKKGKIEVN